MVEGRLATCQGIMVQGQIGCLMHTLTKMALCTQAGRWVEHQAACRWVLATVRDHQDIHPIIHVDPQLLQVWVVPLVEWTHIADQCQDKATQAPPLPTYKSSHTHRTCRLEIQPHSAANKVVTNAVVVSTLSLAIRGGVSTVWVNHP